MDNGANGPKDLVAFLESSSAGANLELESQKKKIMCDQRMRTVHL